MSSTDQVSSEVKGDLRKVVQIDEEGIKSHLGEVVRDTEEETLNAMLDAEAEALCVARRYERTEGRRDYRAGHYTRRLQTKAGEVNLQVPKLRRLPFETAIIERYRRRESSVEEALIEMYLVGVSVRRLGKAAQLVREGARETLAYYTFPSEHWRHLRTNNPLERILREIRRRTRVVGCFPDGHSALMLTAARLRHVAAAKWGSRRNMDMDRLSEMDREARVAKPRSDLVCCPHNRSLYKIPWASPL